jgi:CheY-like chemotaxis protein
MSEKRKLLYVDDEMINIKLFELSFGNDFNVLTAPDAKTGLEIIRNNRDIRVLVSDLRMPGIDGLEFIKQVKDQDPALICMLLTGYIESKVMLEGFNKELIFRYLTKPWQKNELLSTFQDAFERVKD